MSIRDVQITNKCSQFIENKTKYNDNRFVRLFFCSLIAWSVWTSRSVVRTSNEHVRPNSSFWIFLMVHGRFVRWSQYNEHLLVMDEHVRLYVFFVRFFVVLLLLLKFICMHSLCIYLHSYSIKLFLFLFFLYLCF